MQLFYAFYKTFLSDFQRLSFILHSDRLFYKKPNPVYSWVTPLRLLLLLRTRHPNADLRLENLQHNTELRQKCDPLSWKLHEKYVIEPLHEMTRLEREEIRQALGILLTNTLSISIEEGQEIMGLFPKYAMLNHSCQHNTVTLTNIPGVTTSLGQEFSKKITKFYVKRKN